MLRRPAGKTNAGNSPIESKAEWPMLRVLSGIVLTLHPTYNVLSAVVKIALQLSRLSKIGFSGSTVILVIPVQPGQGKGWFSIPVTLAGMWTVVRPVQLRKASHSISTKVSGNLNSVTEAHPLKAPLLNASTV